MLAYNVNLLVIPPSSARTARISARVATAGRR